jgi:hypothetical protein
MAPGRRSLVSILMMGIVCVGCRGPVEVDEDQSVQSVGSSQEVGSEFFGLHLVAAWVAEWPSVPFGLYRMHGATPRWHQLSISEDVWSDDAKAGTGLSRIEAALHFRDIYGPGVPAMYVLGGGPENSSCGWPTWFTAQTDTLKEWRKFVRLVGTRYHGRVKYWQIWNEADSQGWWYCGSSKMLVDLTRSASEELRAIDPKNIIVSPSFTDTTFRMMEEFFKDGGTSYIDIVSWHALNSSVPEADTVLVRRVQTLMRKHDVNKPQWVTEGHSLTGPGLDEAAIMMRAYLVFWLYGVESFSWYSWDIYDYQEPSYPGPWVTLVDGNGVATAAGRAYGTLYEWLVGSRVVNLSISRRLWVVELEREGETSWIAWRTLGSAPWQPPEEARVMHTPKGKMPISTKNVVLGTHPVLFTKE